MTQEPLAYATTPVDMPSGDSFRSAMLQRLKGLLERFGGGRNYLLQRFPTPEHRALFVLDLARHFPRDASVSYVTKTTMPTTVNTEYALHLTDLGWDQSCSTRPPPSRPVLESIFDEILTRTFVTAGDYGFTNYFRFDSDSWCSVHSACPAANLSILTRTKSKH